MAAWVGTDAVDIDVDAGAHELSWTMLFRRKSRRQRAARDDAGVKGRKGHRKGDKPRDVRDGKNALEIEEPDEGHAQ